MGFDKYASYSAEEFIEDQDFRDWVLGHNPASNQDWKAFFIRYPVQKEQADQARLLLLEMHDHFHAADLIDKPLDEFFISDLKKEVGQQQEALVVNMPRRVFFQRMAIAASVVLVLGAALWFGLIKDGWNQKTIATGYGEWKTVTLPDGSTVKLNANSEINFARNWLAGEDRKVWLTGEAFFDVNKDSQGAKFTVFTSDLAVEVLGTTFNVHSRGKQTEVFLEEGKVRLDMGQEEKLMVPGDYIAYSSSQKLITAHNKAETVTHASWKDGSLIIEKPLAEAFEKIEEIFGYRVMVENQDLLAVVKRIAIPMDKIEEAIPILETTIGVNIHIENNILWVK